MRKKIQIEIVLSLLTMVLIWILVYSLNQDMKNIGYFKANRVSKNLNYMIEYDINKKIMIVYNNKTRIGACKEEDAPNSLPLNCIKTYIKNEKENNIKINLQILPEHKILGIYVGKPSFNNVFRINIIPSSFANAYDLFNWLRMSVENKVETRNRELYAILYLSLSGYLTEYQLMVYSRTVIIYLYGNIVYIFDYNPKELHFGSHYFNHIITDEDIAQNRLQFMYNVTIWSVNIWFGDLKNENNFEIKLPEFYKGAELYPNAKDVQILRLKQTNDFGVMATLVTEEEMHLASEYVKHIIDEKEKIFKQSVGRGFSFVF